MVAPTDLYLPDDCWESIFKLLNNGYRKYDHNDLECLSLVSKQFLSITNRLIFSLTFSYNKERQVPLHYLFCRFTNITSLDFSDYKSDLNNLLCQTSCFPWNITSLNLSIHIIPANGLRSFSQNIKTLTSLTLSGVKNFHSTYLFLIADCFPLLEVLNLTIPLMFDIKNIDNNFHNGINKLSLSLCKLRKVDFCGHYYINNRSLLCLFKNLKFLEEADISYCHQITNGGIASALHERPTLKSLSFTNYFKDTSASSFAFIRGCPSLSEIIMTRSYISPEDSNYLMNFVAIPQFRSLHVKSLHLPHVSWLTDENLKELASIFPNLELLDLNGCHEISEEGIFHVLRSCSKIRHLNLRSCVRVNLGRMNFEAPKLEVLDLSCFTVNDETLYVISKNCPGLLKLELEHCINATEKGVKHVLKNCTQLKEINLRGCRVSANDFSSMVFSRPSFRKILDPHQFCFRECKR